jgi:uncharacterized membrane protein YebE (DUF533 family)
MGKANIIYELLRDLIGTAKADGNTDVIRDAIMDNVMEMESELEKYAEFMYKQLEYQNEMNAKLNVIQGKLTGINERLGRR